MTVLPTRYELTQREITVLAGVVEGLSNGEIGRRLFLSEDTVKSHVMRTLRKLGVQNRAAATREAIVRGLVPQPGVVVVNQTITPDPRPCHPQNDPSIGTVTLRADDHDAALLASAWSGGAAPSAVPEMVRDRALTALLRLSGTATAG